MTRPTFASFCTLVAGWVFATRHHVTGALRARHQAGRHATRKHFSAYHRVFAAARWGRDAVGMALLSMILPLLPKDAAVFLVIDDTLCAKTGRRRMYGVDSHYDPSITGRKRSNANQSLKRRGHCWVILGVVLPLPFGPGHCCLPALFRLYMNTKAARRNKTNYRSRVDLARDLLSQVCTRHPGRRFHVLADSAYAGQDTLRQLPDNCDLTARWQMNARLCEPAPTKRQARQRGPLPKRGPILPTPKQMLEEGRCRHLNVELFGRPHPLRVATCLACLYTVPERRLRLVATEPLSRSGKPRPKHRAFYYSTATDADAVQVLQRYAMRWTIEVAIHDAKQQMGFGQPQNWSEPAVQRTAPTLMLLYSVIVLWFREEGHAKYRRPIWPWYRHKTAISFADMQQTLRMEMLRHHLKQNLSDPVNNQGLTNPLRIIARLVRLAA